MPVANGRQTGIQKSITGEATKSRVLRWRGPNRRPGTGRRGGAAITSAGDAAAGGFPEISDFRVKALRDRPPGSKARMKALRDRPSGRVHGKPGAPEGAPGDVAQRGGRVARTGKRQQGREPKRADAVKDRGWQDADRGVFVEVCGGQGARGQVCVQVPMPCGQPGQPERGHQAGPGRAAADHAARSRRMRQRGHPGGGRAQLGGPGHRRGSGLGQAPGGAEAGRPGRWKSCG